MIFRKKRLMLLAAMALVAVTNGLVLLGAAHNRRGAPESVLVLTERECMFPYAWHSHDENSGLTLNIQWRVLPDAESTDSHGYGTPDWLDRNKLAELGFVMPENGAVSLRHTKQLPKEAFLVLELDGPAYRESLNRVQALAREAESLMADNPGVEEFVNREKTARDALEREMKRNSRLFVIDAGLDQPGLRDRYPDRNRYAIVRGQVRVVIGYGNKDPQVNGHITDLSASNVNVPLSFHPVFKISGTRPDTFRYQATVAWGRRLEPWLVRAGPRSEKPS